MNIPARWTSLAYVTGAKMGGGGRGRKNTGKGKSSSFPPLPSHQHLLCRLIHHQLTFPDFVAGLAASRSKKLAPPLRNSWGRLVASLPSSLYKVGTLAKARSYLWILIRLSIHFGKVMITRIAVILGRPCFSHFYLFCWTTKSYLRLLNA